MDGLGDEASVKRARIEVERIQSPVLLVSGLDDRAWPSSLYSRMVADALARSGRAHVVRHLEYANAGYGIHFSYLPATQIARLHPISGVPYTNGGAPGANAFANEQSWQGVLAFLRQALIDCH